MSLLLPVLSFLFGPVLHMYTTELHSTVVQYKKKGRTPTNERTTNEIPFNIKDVRCPCLYSELLIRRSVVLIYSTVLTYRPIDSSTIRRLTTRVRLGPLLRVSWRGRK